VLKTLDGGARGGVSGFCGLELDRRACGAGYESGQANTALHRGHRGPPISSPLKSLCCNHILGVINGAAQFL